MKRSLSLRLKDFACLAILLISVCGNIQASAQTAATSDEINAAIVNSPVPITWVNDSVNPWVTNGQKITCSLASGQRTTISATFTLDRHSLFYTRNDNSYTSSYTYSKINIDGKFTIDTDNYWLYRILLPPGKHTIAYLFYNSTGYNIKFNLTSSVINQQWDEVRVDYPGDFKSKFSQLIDRIINEGRSLSLLKISGTMSSEDWSALRDYTSNDYINGHDNPITLYGIDISDTDITSLPDFCFSNYYTDSYYNANVRLSSLKTVILPASLESISPYAFYKNSGIDYISIPSSVKNIDHSAFHNSSLKIISFNDDSQLESINYDAFNGTQLQGFEMPASVTYIGSRVFNYCWNLTNITLSESLRNIYNSTFASSGIQEIVIPKDVREIGQSAFASCTKLRKVTLNSHTNKLYDTFADCTDLDTLIIKTATPPTFIATSDPFNNVVKDSVTLLVPDFALDSYKNDTYWSQFTKIKASAEISESDFWAITGYVNQNDENKFSDNTSIEIESGGILDIAENTSLAFDEVIFTNEESEPPCFINRSVGVSANKLTSRFIVPSARKWYFFSPAADVDMADITFSNNSSWLIRYYDGERRASENSASGNWQNMPLNGTLKRGQGYIVQTASPGIIEMPAKDSDFGVFLGIEDAAMKLSDFPADSLENTGWNLMANPYPTFYDSRSINCEAPITVWTGSTYRAFSLTDDNYVLRPLQPFFIQKYTGDISFGMPRDGRQSGISSSRAEILRAGEFDSDRSRIDLEISRGERDEADDYSRIVINDDASMSYEGNRDASKFMGLESDIAQIYSFGENQNPMAINERPYADGNVKLGVFIPQAGVCYRISSGRADRKAWLYDSVAGIEQDLTEGDYIFIADKEGCEDARFSIRLAPMVETAVVDIEETGVKVVSGQGIITVAANAGSHVLVVGADGRVIADVRMDDSFLDLPVAAGVYVVKVNENGYKSIVR